MVVKIVVVSIRIFLIVFQFMIYMIQEESGEGYS